mmetsp:Transcript_11917/g.38289  ORF Transcript_11917/g.38289 Transcript_11917/m.38289 type:complete len:682 (-) Transcript_11917:148-2193(-)
MLEDRHRRVRRAANERPLGRPVRRGVGGGRRVARQRHRLGLCRHKQVLVECDRRGGLRARLLRDELGQPRRLALRVARAVAGAHQRAAAPHPPRRPADARAARGGDVDRRAVPVRPELDAGEWLLRHVPLERLVVEVQAAQQVHLRRREQVLPLLDVVGAVDAHVGREDALCRRAHPVAVAGRGREREGVVEVVRRRVRDVDAAGGAKLLEAQRARHRAAPDVEVEADRADDASDGGAGVDADADVDVHLALLLDGLHLADHAERHGADAPRRVGGVASRLAKGAAADDVRVADRLDLVHAVPLGQPVKLRKQVGQEAEDKVGGSLARELGEADHVRLQHRHLVIPVRHLRRPRRDVSYDGRREGVEEEPLHAVAESDLDLLLLLEQLVPREVVAVLCLGHAGEAHAGEVDDGVVDRDRGEAQAGLRKGAEQRQPCGEQRPEGERRVPRLQVRHQGRVPKQVHQHEQHLFAARAVQHVGSRHQEPVAPEQGEEHGAERGWVVEHRHAARAPERRREARRREADGEAAEEERRAQPAARQVRLHVELDRHQEEGEADGAQREDKGGAQQGAARRGERVPKVLGLQIRREAGQKGEVRGRARDGSLPRHNPSLRGAVSAACVHLARGWRAGAGTAMLQPPDRDQGVCLPPARSRRVATLSWPATPALRVTRYGPRETNGEVLR